MLDAGAGRRRRVVGAVTGLLALVAVAVAPAGASVLAAASAAAPSAPVAAAAPPLECGVVYSQKNQAPHNIRSVDTSSGALTTVGAFAAPAGQINAIGLTGDGRSMYGTMYDATARTVAVYRWDATTGTTQTVGRGWPVDFTNATHGGVDPATGVYYWAGSPNTDALNVYGYNPATDRFLGLVARVPRAGVAAGQTNGDLVFDSAGTAYLTSGSATQSRLVRLDEHLPTTPVSARDYSYTQLSTITTTTAINGIAFGSDGYLYVASGSVIGQVHPTTGVVLRSVTMSATDSVDLASCASPNTITAQKDFPEGRAASGDQVRLTVTGGGLAQGNAGDGVGGG